MKTIALLSVLIVCLALVGCTKPPAPSATQTPTPAASVAPAATEKPAEPPAEMVGGKASGAAPTLSATTFGVVEKEIDPTKIPSKLIAKQRAKVITIKTVRCQRSQSDGKTTHYDLEFYDQAETKPGEMFMMPYREFPINLPPYALDAANQPFEVNLPLASDTPGKGTDDGKWWAYFVMPEPKDNKTPYSINTGFALYLRLDSVTIDKPDAGMGEVIGTMKGIIGLSFEKETEGETYLAGPFECKILS
jgi:hypothetical protein